MAMCVPIPRNTVDHVNFWSSRNRWSDRTRQSRPRRNTSRLRPIVHELERASTDGRIRHQYSVHASTTHIPFLWMAYATHEYPPSWRDSQVLVGGVWTRMSKSSSDSCSSRVVVTDDANNIDVEKIDIKRSNTCEGTLAKKGYPISSALKKIKQTSQQEIFYWLENPLSVSFRIPLLMQWTVRNGIQTNMEGQTIFHLKLTT